MCYLTNSFSESSDEIRFIIGSNVCYCYADSCSCEHFYPTLGNKVNIDDMYIWWNFMDDNKAYPLLSDIPYRTKNTSRNLTIITKPLLVVIRQ